MADQWVFKSETYSIWGGSLVKGEDGKYHMFYSRWPKAPGWVWVSHSEIRYDDCRVPVTNTLGGEGEGMVQVLSGLDGTERVVTSAQFLIDSEARLAASIGAMTGGSDGAEEIRRLERSRARDISEIDSLVEQAMEELK